VLRSLRTPVGKPRAPPAALHATIVNRGMTDDNVQPATARGDCAARSDALFASSKAQRRHRVARNAQLLSLPAARFVSPTPVPAPSRGDA
jgi:hypothetical protein